MGIYNKIEREWWFRKVKSSNDSKGIYASYWRGLQGNICISGKTRISMLGICYYYFKKTLTLAGQLCVSIFEQ